MITFDSIYELLLASAPGIISLVGFVLTIFKFLKAIKEQKSDKAEMEEMLAQIKKYKDDNKECIDYLVAKIDHIKYVVKEGESDDRKN